jgi:hypothetical protein
MVMHRIANVKEPVAFASLKVSEPKLKLLRREGNYMLFLHPTKGIRKVRIE